MAYKILICAILCLGCDPTLGGTTNNFGPGDGNAEECADGGVFFEEDAKPPPDKPECEPDDAGAEPEADAQVAPRNVRIWPPVPPADLPFFNVPAGRVLVLDAAVRDRETGDPIPNFIVQVGYQLAPNGREFCAEYQSAPGVVACALEVLVRRIVTDDDGIAKVVLGSHVPHGPRSRDTIRVFQDGLEPVEFTVRVVEPGE